MLIKATRICNFNALTFYTFHTASSLFAPSGDMHGHKWDRRGPYCAVGSMNHKQNNLHANEMIVPSQVFEIHNQYIFYNAVKVREKHVIYCLHVIWKILLIYLALPAILGD